MRKTGARIYTSNPRSRCWFNAGRDEACLRTCKMAPPERKIPSPVADSKTCSDQIARRRQHALVEGAAQWPVQAAIAASPQHKSP
jgi:hypothetical protein